MEEFLEVLFVLIGLFALNILIWKFKIPKRQTNVLLKIYFGGQIIYLLALVFFEGQIDFNILFAKSVFLTSSSLAYIMFYSGLEVDSPTLVIVKKVANTGKEGLLEKDLYQVLTDDILVRPRVNDLIRDRFLVRRDDLRYYLTEKGQVFIRIMNLWCRVVGISKKVESR